MLDERERKALDQLVPLSDIELVGLYRLYSDREWCSGWHGVTDRGADNFVTWVLEHDDEPRELLDYEVGDLPKLRAGIRRAVESS